MIQKDTSFDLILIDVFMPEVSCAQLASELTDQYPDLAKRVVFISAPPPSTLRSHLSVEDLLEALGDPLGDLL